MFELDEECKIAKETTSDFFKKNFQAVIFPSI